MFRIKLGRMLTSLLSLCLVLVCLLPCYSFAELQEVRVSDIVTFGHYEQDNQSSNGMKPIEWIILSVENGEALLLSLRGLDCQQYHGKFDSVTWETSAVREWLNSEFLNAAFSYTINSKILGLTFL